MILCVLLLTQTMILGFCLQYTYTQVLEASYLHFVFSSDFIYDVSIKKSLGWFLFEAVTLIIGYWIELYFRGSNKKKSQENLEQQGGPFYSEADYL